MLWKTFLSYAVLVCSTLSVTIGWLLWSRKHVNRYANRLLALLLFIYSYINFVTSLIINGAILDVPHFFRTAAPLNYLIGPLIYLYVRASLFSSNRFDYRFSWLFLPALLNVIELIPFYIRSSAEKVAYLQKLPSMPDSIVTIAEGWLPPGIHLAGYTLSSLLYSLLTGWMLWQYLVHEKSGPYSNSIYANWIKTFVIIHVVSNLIWAVELLFLGETAYASFGLNITRVVGQFIICLYVIQRPTLLYGAYRLGENSPDVPPKANEYAISEAPKPDPIIAQPPNQSIADEAIGSAGRPILEDELDIQRKLELLEAYMTEQQPYLQPRLSLANVSVATNISPYLLSAMLNRVLGLDFRDYINAYRVRYLCLLLQSNQYNHLTLEGIGMEAGFSSKTTFYRAFQKHTGLTPAQYSNLNSQPESE